ncbi:MAG: OmpP1/FadL family transporter [Vicinamibacterales bacterium]
MRLPQSRSFASYLGIVLFLALAASDVAADGWKIQLMGGKGLSSSYAGRSVLAEDASAVWFNPAAIAWLPGEAQLTAGAPIISYQLDFHDSGSRSLLGQSLSGDKTRNGGKTAAVPHVYFATALSDRWRFGFSFNAPYGLGTNYGETWVGRYHATETTLTVFNINPALAVRLNDAVALGFGLDVQRSQAVLANRIDFGSIGAASGLPLSPQGHDGKVEFTGSDWAAGFNAGLRWQASRRTAVGIAYRSQIEHALRGTADFTVPAAAGALTAGGRVFSDTEAEVILPMPHELSVSASHDLNRRWTLLGDATWTRWSSFKELRVTFENPAQPTIQQPANWRDSKRVAVGAKGALTDRWSFRTGAAYETAPVPAATRTPRLPEENHTWLSAGATYAGSNRWSFDAHVSHLITPDAAVSLTDPAAGQLIGDVHWRLTVAGVSVTRRF